MSSKFTGPFFEMDVTEVIDILQSDNYNEDMLFQEYGSEVVLEAMKQLGIDYEHFHS